MALDLVDAEDVTAAVAVMHEALGSDADEVVVQAMIPPGLDLRIRITVDERIGPLDRRRARRVDGRPRRRRAVPAGPAVVRRRGGVARLVRVGPALAAAELPSAQVVDTWSGSLNW